MESDTVTFTGVNLIIMLIIIMIVALTWMHVFLQRSAESSSSISSNTYDKAYQCFHLYGWVKQEKQKTKNKKKGIHRGSNSEPAACIANALTITPEKQLRNAELGYRVSNINVCKV